MVFGRQFVYIRDAGAEVRTVKVVTYPGGWTRDLLKEDWKERMNRYKNGDEVHAPVEDVEWSGRLVAASLAGEVMDGFRVRYEVDFVDDRSTTKEIHDRPDLLDFSVDPLPGGRPKQYGPTAQIQYTSAAGSSNDGLQAPVPAMPSPSSMPRSSTDVMNKDSENAIQDSASTLHPVKRELPDTQDGRPAGVWSNLRGIKKPRQVIDLTGV